MPKPSCRCWIAAAAFTALAGKAGASIMTPKLIGYDTTLELLGSDGVGRDGSKWKSLEGGDAQSTNWSNQRIDFFANLGDTPFEYTIGVTARNDTTLQLPDNYTQFKVGVSVNDSFVDYLYIDASDSEWNTSWIDVGELSGETKVTLNWVNDSYKAGHYDANFAVGAVQFVALIPAPGAGALAILGIGLAAPRRHRM